MYKAPTQQWQRRFSGQRAGWKPIGATEKNRLRKACCLNCITKRAEPGAKVYTTCAEDIMLLGTLSRRRTVAAGCTITYKVTVKNQPLTDLLLTVNLPEGMTYVKSKLSRDKRAAQKATISTNGNVVTVADFSLRAHQKRTFKVRVRVNANTPAAT